MNGFREKSFNVLFQIHGKEVGQKEILSLEDGIESEPNKIKINIKELFNKSFRFVFIVGLIIGVLQQITGINAVYFYATSIFKQTGIGTDASFSSGVLLSSISVIFTFVAIYLIDRMGRRPLLLIGTAGIAFSLLLCSFGFSQATYRLNSSDISEFSFSNSNKLELIVNKTYDSDVVFKKDLKRILGNQIYSKNDGEILETATSINAKLVLIGILSFIACFAFSLGPVMWVLLSEMFPLKFKGLAIGVIAFVNSLISSLVQLIFPWELSNLGNALTFFIFGFIAAVGFLILLKVLPETKGQSLEELEQNLINDI
jgi:MFS family permease